MRRVSWSVQPIATKYIESVIRVWPNSSKTEFYIEYTIFFILIQKLGLSSTEFHEVENNCVGIYRKNQIKAKLIKSNSILTPNQFSKSLITVEAIFVVIQNNYLIRGLNLHIYMNSISFSLIHQPMKPENEVKVPHSSSFFFYLFIYF